MLRQRVEQLQHEYTDQYVVVDGDRPELARFRGMTGQVKTINMSGRALVQFDLDKQAGWYDIKLDYLKVVDKPQPPAPTEAKKPAEATKSAAKKEEPPAPKEPKLSPLELARKEKEEQKEREAQQAGGDAPTNAK